MNDRIPYSSLGLPVDVVSKVVDLKEELSLKSNGEAIQVLLAAYDIINGTGHGGEFTEAVKQAIEHGRGEKR